MTREEGNKLIAEFHGWKHTETPKKKGKGYWDFPGWGRAQWSLDSMLYHSSWDWLMPVVEKIQSKGYDFIIFNDEDGEQAMIYGAGFSYKRDEASLVIPNKPNSSLSKIHIVWNTVIEFIQWHKQTNLNHDR